MRWSPGAAMASLAVVGLGVASAAYVAGHDPSEPGNYPPCPVKALTGWDCPGCGGLRAAYCLLHGDVLGAVDHNALLVVVLLPLAMAALAVGLLRAAGRSTPRLPPVWAGYLLVGLLVVFTVARNVPGVPLDAA